MLNLSFFSSVAAKFRATPILNTHGVRIIDLDELFEASFAAECAWMDEVRRQWRRKAFQARFDERGVSTPRLRQLYEQFKAAEAVYQEASGAVAEPLTPPQSQPRPVENTEPAQPAPLEMAQAA
jgi:hypothetical protein